MNSPIRVSFDSYLDTVFASSNWVEGCLSMLSAFLESVDSCRDDPGQRLPDLAPSIVDQVEAVAGRVRRLESRLRAAAEAHGPEFQTSELGAALWWAGMASHKAMGAVPIVREHLSHRAWEKAFYEVHALMFDVISAISLLALAEGMIHRMEAERRGPDRPN